MTKESCIDLDKINSLIYFMPKVDLSYLKAAVKDDKIICYTNTKWCLHCACETEHMHHSVVRRVLEYTKQSFYGDVCLDCGIHFHKDTDYRRIKQLDILFRDDFECVYCGAKEKLITKKRPEFTSFKYKPSRYTVTACLTCQGKVEAKRKLKMKFGRYRVSARNPKIIE